MNDEDSDVLIIGAGGFGREVLQYCLDAQVSGWAHSVIGFLDDRSDALKAFRASVPIAGGFKDMGEVGARNFIIALGDPAARRAAAESVSRAGGRLISVIHPSAYVAPTAAIGDGTVLCPHSMIGANSIVESNVAVNIYASIGHDARIGEHCVISPYAAVLGSATLGDEVLLGTHSTISPGTMVGRRSRVAIGSAVTRDTEAGSLLVGNPATGRVMYAQNQ